VDSFKVKLSRPAEKELFSLDKIAVGRIWPKIRSLADNPYPKGSLKLSGVEDSYRIRVGKFRVIYKIDGNEVTVVGIKPRKEAYR
jgi:mRNA interferase RelE/StbE